MTAGGLFRQLSYFAATALFAQKMMPAQFGLASLWYAASLILVGIGDWGVRFAGWSAVARSGLDPEIVSSHLYAKSITAAATALLMVVGILAGFADTGRPALVAALVLLLFVNQLSVEWIFRALSRFRDVFVMNLLAGLTMLLGAFVVDPGATATHYLAAVLVSNLVAVTWGTALLLRSGFRPVSVTPTRVWRQIRQSTALAIVSVVNRSYAQLPLLFVGLLASAVVVADFRISHMLFMFASTFSYYLVAALYSNFAAGAYSRPELARTFGLLGAGVVVLLPLAYLGAEFVAPWIVDTAFGVEYASAVPMLAVTFWVLPVGFVGMFVREFAPAIGLDRQLLRASIIAIICGGISLYLLSRFAVPAVFPVALGVTECVIIGLFLYAAFATPEGSRSISRGQHGV